MAATLVVNPDGRSCKGIIAALEDATRYLEPGSLIEVVVTDVLNRIDVLAWARRKGHVVVREAWSRPGCRILLERGGRSREAGLGGLSESPGSGARSGLPPALSVPGLR